MPHRLLLKTFWALLVPLIVASPANPPLFQHTLSVAAPSVNIVIKNLSKCPLLLMEVQHDNNQTSLSLPKEILAAPSEKQQVIGTGHISFSGGYFSSMQQRATGTYQVTCDNQRHLLSLSFFIAPDYYGDGYWIEKQFSSSDIPLLLSPPGKTSIAANTPVVLTLINKEVFDASKADSEDQTEEQDPEDAPDHNNSNPDSE